MSFVGAVGHFMVGSGPEDIVKSAVAGVPKLLSGKKLPSECEGTPHGDGGNSLYTPHQQTRTIAQHD